MARIIVLMVLPVIASGYSDRRPSNDAPAESASIQAQESESSETSGGTDLNLLGSTDADSGESRRNENNQFDPIDNNALKELIERVGATATLVPEFKADQRYFGTEYGNDAEFGIHATPKSGFGLARKRFTTPTTIHYSMPAHSSRWAT